MENIIKKIQLPSGGIYDIYDEGAARKDEILQSDWDQNDSTQLDYIKNRTHWDNSIIDDTVECDLTFSELTNGSGVTVYQCVEADFVNTISFPYGFSYEKEYDIVWNGFLGTFHLKDLVFNNLNFSYLGNLSLLGFYDSSFQEDTGEPFFIMIDGDVISNILTDEPDFSRFTITGKIPQVVQLDEKFIPDSIKTSIENKLDREIYNEKITQIETAISEKAEASALENLEDRVSSLAESTAVNFETDRIAIEGLSFKQDELEADIADLQSNKVNVIPGKDLSSNDYTTAEKNKLANIAENANNYSLPAATETTLGGIKIGKNVTYEGQQLGVTSDNISSALGYVPAKNVDIDTSLSMSGAAADAKTVGDLIDSLDQVIALDENANGNVVLQSYIIADEEEGGGAAGRLDSSLTQAGVAPDSKAVGDAINLRMLANAVIPVTQGGSGKTTAVESFKVLQSRGLLTGDMNSMMDVGAGWVQLANCTNTPYGNNPTGKNGYLEVIEPESGEILQRYTNHADGAVWLRSYANNSWTAWFEGGASSTIVPASKGGTGHDFSSIPANAIIRNSGDNTQLWYTPTASGALYATAANGAVKFGTLPIAQGGTGATTAAAACTALGALPKSGGTITGSLYINNITDGSSTADSNVGLIIGNRSGTHIIIDTNEIIAKDSKTTGGTLILGDASSAVHINSKLILRNNYIYGTSLPAAGTAGRIFFKKV